MSRIETVNPAQATGKAKELLDGVQVQAGDDTQLDAGDGKFARCVGCVPEV